MARFKSFVLIASALLCAALFAVGLVGIVLGRRAQATATTMETCEWINNDRCLEKIAAMPEPHDGFRIAVLGDVQIGTAQLPRLMDALEEQGPIDFIIQTGDISTGPDAGHYTLLMSALAHAGLRWPMFVVPGNHDVRKGDDESFRRYFGPGQFWFEYGRTLFIFLDNSLGPFTDAQCDWLESVLAEQSTAVRNTVLVMHCQPIYWHDDGRGPVAHLYKGFNRIFTEYKIDYVLSGNWHGYHREERDGTKFIVNGRGGSGSHLAPCFYTIINIDEQGAWDRCFVLPPSAGMLAKSLVDDWLIAHVGGFAANNRLVTWALIFVAGLGAVSLILLAKK